MRRLLREPLFHFVLAGVLIFLLAGRFGSSDTGSDRRIVVTETTVANLSTGFERTWMRPPTSAERNGLVDDFVKEEILYREALALGLDRGDIVIRRRLRQKMEFLQADLVDPGPLSDAELEAFLMENAERFQIPATLSFRQVFVDPTPSKGPAEPRVAQLIGRLRAAPEGAGDVWGDPTLLPRSLERATPRQVAAQFGPGFFEAVAEMPVASWSGPVASSYGLHVVWVGEHAPARRPELDEVRDAVERELRMTRRNEGSERVYRELRERYDVTIDAQAGTADQDASGSSGSFTSP
jgi:hypothetical protein